MRFQFTNSFRLGDEVNKFSAVGWNQMAGRSDQILEPPRSLYVPSRLYCLIIFSRRRACDSAHLQVAGAIITSLPEYYVREPCLNFSFDASNEIRCNWNAFASVLASILLNTMVTIVDTISPYGLNNLAV